MKFNTELPIYEKREEIINAVNNCDTVIISAETGSGKSSQVPQYLFSSGYNVIVTQPRRIACVSLADRVVEEMGSEYEKYVAYHTAFESTRTQDTKILFCTDGLQVAKGMKNLNNTVLVIDEVHEWNLNIETLVAWVKQFRLMGNNIKVVLMSATMEYDALKLYFGSAELITVKGRNYDVKMISAHPMDFNSIIREYIMDNKNILIFKEGKKEIGETIEDLKDEYGNLIEALPLHGELGISDQRLCFKSYPVPKIIVATNVAQTSITIPDIDVVIDNGMEKRIEADENGIEGLYTKNISKADCLQRAGRAGRTKNGVYVLCSTKSLNSREPYTVPEIQRLVIDKVVLKLISVNIDPLSIEFFHQPEINKLESSIESLKDLGALDANSNITNTGKRMIKMPVSVRSARMIIEAEKLGCVTEVIKAVAILETGSMVNFYADKNDWEKFSYSDFTTEGESDIIAELNIFNSIVKYRFENLQYKGKGLSKKNFYKAKDLVNKLTSVLTGLIDFNDCDSSKDNINRSIIAGILNNIYYNYGDSVLDQDRKSYKLSKNACCRYSSARFCFGFPKIITYKNRWGLDDELNIIDNVICVSNSMILSLFNKDEFNTVYDDDESKYDPHSNSFIVPYKVEFRGFTYDSGNKIVKEDDDMFPHYSKMYSNAMKQDSDTIIIGNSAYEIEDSWDGGYYIYLSNDTDVLLSDLKTVDYNGRKVCFCYYPMKNINLNIIRDKIKDNRLKKRLENEKKHLPNKSSLSLNVLLNEFIPAIKTVNVGEPLLHEELIYYVGLDAETGKISMKLFDTKESFEKSTNEALLFFMRKYIGSQFGDKNFIVKINGKKTETKKSIKAKELFHEYCEMALEDLSVSNFQEQFDFINSTFDECIESFTK